MKDTYYPTLSTSLNSADLTYVLANKLKERLGTDGSMIYTQKWKEKVTPAGLVLSAHTASTPRTKGRDSTGQPSGWRTSQAHNASQGPKSEAFYLECVKTGKSAITLTDEARHAEVSGWPTPRTRDQKGGYVGGRIRNGKLSTDTLDVAAQIAGCAIPIEGWPTPRSTEIEEDYEVYLRRMRNSKHAKNRGKTKPNNVAMTAQIAGWPTSSASNALNKSTDAETRKEQVDERTQKCYQDAKNDARKGITQSSGYTAGMESTGQLNPALSRWLMAFPTDWCEAAIIANRLMLTTVEKLEPCD